MCHKHFVTVYRCTRLMVYHYAYKDINCRLGTSFLSHRGNALFRENIFSIPQGAGRPCQGLLKYAGLTIGVPAAKMFDAAFS